MKKVRELISEQDYQQAIEAGREAIKQPHAVRASYNARNHTLTIAYSNSFNCSFDIRHASFFQESPNADYSMPLVTPGGDGLIFEKADISVDVAMLVSTFLPPNIGNYWAASRQGRKTSAAKATAARINGAKGGRPKKNTEATATQRPRGPLRQAS
ncbi:hypothetical protein ACXZ1M_05800 [Duganella sp. PWIR1]